MTVYRHWSPLKTDKSVHDEVLSMGRQAVVFKLLRRNSATDRLQTARIQ